MDDYVEFYITCNPPLLPNGVSAVIDAAHQYLQEKLTEVLYEPEIPWFKIIIPVPELQSDVTSYFEGHLENIFNEDPALDGPRIDDYRSDCSDLESLGETKIVPWVQYHQGRGTTDASYDAYRFPSPFDRFTHKTVWRGLESSIGATVSNLLPKFGFLSQKSSSNSSIQLKDLEKLTGCSITHNLAGNLVYIGSNQGPDAVQSTVRKLQNFLSLIDVGGVRTTHSVFTENLGPSQLSYRYLSHIGLLKMTYIVARQWNDEYKRLGSATSLRVNTLDEQGYWALDKTVYRPEASPEIENWKPFAAFDGYSYSPKQGRILPPSISPSPSPERRNKKAKMPASHILAMANDPSPTVELGPSLDVQFFGAQLAGKHELRPKMDLPNSHRGLGKSSPEVKKWLKNVPLPLLTRRPSPPSSSSSSPSLSPSSAPEPSVGEAILSNAPLINIDIPSTRLETERPTGLHESSREEVLIDFSLPNAEPVLQDTRPSQGNLLDQQVWGEPNESTFPVLNPCNTFRVLSRSSSTPQSVHLLDVEVPMEIPARALADIAKEDSTKTSPDDVALFEKRQDQDLLFFQTMGQQASRKDNWPEVASTPPRPAPSENAFGVNVRVSTGSPRPRCQSKRSEQGSSIPAPQGSSMEPMTTSCLPMSSSAMIPQVVPGLDLPVRSRNREGDSKARGHAEMLKKCEADILSLSKVLQITPGKVELEAHFGRAYIKELHPSLISCDTCLPWSMDQVLKTLNSSTAGEDRLGFQTILTTKGEDMDLLVRASGLKGGSWRFQETQVRYDIFCSSREGDRQDFVVELNADDFSHVCRNPKQAITGLVVHCARRAWDIKVSLNCTPLDALPQRFERFAERLVSSLTITPEAEGSVTIEAEQDQGSSYAIRGIEIRHVARYNNKDNGSLLNVTMTRSVKQHRGSKDNLSAYRGSTSPLAVPGRGQPTQWFEATITSARIEERFRENMKLELGDMATWVPEKLVKDGIIQEIVDPALRMVRQMDEVGRTNVNDQQPQSEQPFLDPIMLAGERNKDWYYW